MSEINYNYLFKYIIIGDTGKNNFSKIRRRHKHEVKCSEAYLAFTDSHPDALGGFTAPTLPTMGSNGQCSVVSFSDSIAEAFDAEHIEALRGILASDPRPHYHEDPDRIYALEFAGKEVKFRIGDGQVEAWIECNNIVP